MRSMRGKILTPEERKNLGIARILKKEKREEAAVYDLALKNLSALQGMGTGLRCFDAFMSFKALYDIMDSNIEKGQETELVYICCPNTGADEEETGRNAEKARACGFFAETLGKIPVMPHSVWPADLFVPCEAEDENSEQELKTELRREQCTDLRRKLSMALIRHCDSVWVFRDGEDTGEMQAEILLARLLKKPIRILETGAEAEETDFDLDECFDPDLFDLEEE